MSCNSEIVNKCNNKVPNNLKIGDPARENQQEHDKEPSARAAARKVRGLSA